MPLNRADSLVSVQELAKLYGVTVYRVRDWLERGCPYEQKGYRGVGWRLDPEAVAAWLEDSDKAPPLSQVQPRPCLQKLVRFAVLPNQQSALTRPDNRPEITENHRQ